MKKIAVQVLIIFVAVEAGALVGQQAGLFWGAVVAALVAILGIVTFYPILGKS